MTATVHLIPMSDIIAEYQPGPGRHWFDPSAIRFFRSRIARTAYRGPGGTFFVSSEQPPHPVHGVYGQLGQRRWTVREFVPESEETPQGITTAGKFMEFSNRASATARAKELAKG